MTPVPDGVASVLAGEIRTAQPTAPQEHAEEVARLDPAFAVTTDGDGPVPLGEWIEAKYRRRRGFLP